MVDYLKEALSLDSQEVATAKGIDTYTQHFTQFASDPTGQQALANLLGNQTAPKEQRAAAAQALNPGMKASIGDHGELSFTAAPGASLGYQNPDPMYKERTVLQAKVAGGQTNNILETFDATFRSIQGAKDIIEVENIYASLNSSASDYIAARELSIKNRISTSLGIPALESQLAADRQLDTEYYASTGRVYQGPTNETLANLQMYNNETARLDQLVAKELSADPEIVALKTRLQGVESIVNSKRTLANKAMAGEAVSEDITALVDPTAVKSAALVLGIDATNPKVRDSLIEQLANGRGPAVEANKIAAMSTTDLLGIATSDTPEAKYATNVLGTKFSNSDDVKYLADQIKNFDREILPSLSKETREALTPGAVNYGQGVEAKKQAALDIQRMKANIVLEKFQQARAASFSAGIEAVGTGAAGGWAMPQSPELVELPKVIQIIKEQNPDSPVTLDRLAARMDWSTNRQAKVNALAEWAYSQALLEPNNEAMGMPTGYHSIDAIKSTIQTQIVKLNSKTTLGTGRGAILRIGSN